MDPVVFSRRDFLKLVGVGVAGAAAGCGKPPAEKLMPYLVAPEDILPGVPYFYASTCRECPAGCGVVARTREGRVIKLEGNPDQPVGQGGLCARGHGALHGLYNPDRLRSPMVRNGGTWTPVSWEQALATAADKLKAANGKVLLLTGYEAGTLRALAGEFAAGLGGHHLMSEPFAFEAVRAANQKTFGIGAVPQLDFAAARCVISFGTDFLETFGSPVSQARGYAALRAERDGGAGYVVSVEPRLSLTGANADEWVAIRPGTEIALALGLAHVILAENLGPARPERAALAAAVADYTPEAVEKATEVPAATVTRLARLFAKQSPSLAVAGGVATQGAQATALCAAVNLLNHAAGNVGRTLRFGPAQEWAGVGSFADLRAQIAAMNAGNVQALVVAGPNPAYATPKWAGFAVALGKVPFKLALVQTMDETAELCDLVLPASHALESFGDWTGTRGVYALQQPAMKRLPMFDSRPTGDALIALGKAAGIGAKWPDTFHDYLKAAWQPLHARFGAGADLPTFWDESLQKGGVWEDVPEPPVRWAGAPAFPPLPPPVATGGALALLVTPSNNFYDGRGANRPWLQELPDMTSKTVWGSWAEVHPDTAKALGVKNGEPLRLETPAGSVEAPAFLYPGIRRDTVAIALGQGHTSYGRYAANRGVNALDLLPEAMDAASGALAYQGAAAKVTRAQHAMPLFFQQEDKNQHGRGVAQVITVAELLAGREKGEQALQGHPLGDPNAYPDYHTTGTRGGEADPRQRVLGTFTVPQKRPDGWQAPAHSVSAYQSDPPVRHPSAKPVNVGSYAHAEHRWAMAVDLNSCTGCAACVVACNSENNIPVVGPELMRRGREMAWLRVDRFEEQLGGGGGGASGPADVRFVPMMCQHCSDAPCEMVCPVYATYHNPEGLNAQVYNRCVGTRYCSNNCPYKVRAFNWFDYSAPEKATFAFPEPLNWQLNPDVTVRSKGVMEKCTMCIQRILEGKGKAKDENRKLKDGEFTTACAQSCPTQAITFGDLLDPASAVHRKSLGERRYWVFEELYTRPGVTYLQRVRRPDGGAA
ncbi:MAG TPA: molybdopterin-dependent oxidoreductase [Candidatus Eisenbacteria bacterium]|nr:molybdopterin-dependent oxidoreductase [Candidatus Eisenbacteria bacterium]